MGKCHQCGKCCTVIHLIYPNRPEIKEWCRARGMKIVQASDSNIEWSLHHPCPQLKGGKVCSIQKKKPKICSDFPHVTGYEELGLSANEGLMKGCGFKE